jgi:hypothetical protein
MRSIEMNVTSSGTLAKKYYAGVLADPTASLEAKESAAAKLVSLEQMKSNARRDRRIKELQKQLFAALARIKELQALIPVQSPILNSLRDVVERSGCEGLKN